METKGEDAKVSSVVGFLLRLPIGVLFLFAGLNKFLGGYGNFVGWILQEMTEKTWLPKVLLYPYAYALPFIEAIVGVLLILGLLTRPVLIVTALLLTSLMFGKVLAQDYATAANNANYVLITAIAYYFSRHNRFSLDALRKSRRSIEYEPSTPL